MDTATDEPSAVRSSVSRESGRASPFRADCYVQGMALLTLVPMLLMGVLAFAAPALESAIGARRSVILALLLICGGCALRVLAWSGWTLVITAAIIGLGVATVQAVFPGMVKREFSSHVGLMTGLYSAMLLGGGALAP